MKTKLYNNRNLWLSISLVLISVVACKSKKAPVEAQQPQVIEQPKPVTEAQTDSLKNELDKKRAEKMKKP